MRFAMKRDAEMLLLGSDLGNQQGSHAHTLSPVLKSLPPFNVKLTITFVAIPSPNLRERDVVGLHFKETSSIGRKSLASLVSQVILMRKPAQS